VWVGGGGGLLWQGCRRGVVMRGVVTEEGRQRQKEVCVHDCEARQERPQPAPLLQQAKQSPA